MTSGRTFGSMKTMAWPESRAMTASSADAVLGQQRLQVLAEAIAREPAEVCDGALEPADGAGGVERAAAGMGRERVDRVRHGDQVDERFARDEDHSGHGGARYMRVVDNRVMVTSR